MNENKNIYNSSSSSSAIDEENINNLKARNSDGNVVSNQIEMESEEASGLIAINAIQQKEKEKAEKRIRKKSVISIPEVEGEDEIDDEFLFIRLRKQIRNHWKKITKNYPNGKVFFRPNLSTESISISQAQLPTESTEPSIGNKNLNSNELLIGGIFKSVILLPAYACKRDDEGRRTVPLISSLLQVNINPIYKVSECIISHAIFV